MKKRFLFLFLSVFFLAACGRPSQPASERKVSKPRLPAAQKPGIPSQNLLGANALGALEDPTLKPSGMQALLSRIDARLNPSVITTGDIERGWYYGQKNDRKLGTPDSWSWTDQGGESKWVSPPAVNASADAAVDALCRSTAGTYAFSCIERERADCQHIPQSLCRCPEQTQWVEHQGCILIDDQGDWVSIDPSDLKRGWYLGLRTQRKRDTPANWVWQDAGKDSRWQTPSPWTTP